MNMVDVDERIVMVFLRDRVRDLATGYKTRGTWIGGRFDDGSWRTGDRACDCVRGPMLYGGRQFDCGAERFRIERIVVWDTGEEVFTEGDGPRSIPRGHSAPVSDPAASVLDRTEAS
jgi:hypothetical protein